MSAVLIAAARKADEEISAVHAAFGAPGDYGYETREGRALFSLYRFQQDLRTAIAAAVDTTVPPAERAKCGCLECRVRAALFGGETDAPFEVNTGEAIKALGNVLAELLAHHSSKNAKSFTAWLLTERKAWLKHPRVAAQHPVGNA